MISVHNKQKNGLFFDIILILEFKIKRGVNDFFIFIISKLWVILTIWFAKLHNVIVMLITFN